MQRFDLSREGGRGGGGALVALVDDPRLAVESVELTLRGRRPVGGGGHLGVGAVEDGGSLLVAASHAGDLGLDPGDAVPGGGQGRLGLRRPGACGGGGAHQEPAGGHHALERDEDPLGVLAGEASRLCGASCDVHPSQGRRGGRAERPDELDQGAATEGRRRESRGDEDTQRLPGAGCLQGALGRLGVGDHEHAARRADQRLQGGLRLRGDLHQVRQDADHPLQAGRGEAAGGLGGRPGPHLRPGPPGGCLALGLRERPQRRLAVPLGRLQPVFELGQSLDVGLLGRLQGRQGGPRLGEDGTRPLPGRVQGLPALAGSVPLAPGRFHGRRQRGELPAHPDRDPLGVPLGAPEGRHAGLDVGQRGLG